MAKKSAAADKPVAAKADDDWRAEGDLRTLIEAEKIRKDAGRYKAAMAKRAELKKELEAIVE